MHTEDVTAFAGMTTKLLLLLSCLSNAFWVRAAMPPTTASETTITSDELEILDNGAQTVFTGHVVLTQDPYQLFADRMTQIKATGIVEAKGHIRGTWKGDKGERSVATGANARYTPAEKVTELWGDALLTRWETAADTQPVTVTADHFTAYDQDHTVHAQGHVVMQQPPGLRTLSDEAKYDRTTETIALWGAHPVQVHWEDVKGAGDFEGERAWLVVSPKRAKLEHNVHGHVVPSS